MQRLVLITILSLASALAYAQTSPAPQSTSTVRVTVVPWKTEELSKTSGNKAVYPQIAAIAHVEGCVYISTLISTDGSIRELVYLGGPALMRESAMKAVVTWKFKPSGQEVGTVVPICYFLSADKEEKLLASYQETVEQVANNRGKLVSFGNELYLIGLTEHAEAQFQSALSLAPGDPEAGFGLGDSLAAEGRFDDAIAAYRQCLTAHPKYLSEDARFRDLHRTNDNPLLLYAVGEVYERRGDKKHALKSYKAVMKLMPSRPEFREAYNRLGRK